MLDRPTIYGVGAIACLVVIAAFVKRRWFWKCWTGIWDWVSGLIPDMPRQKLVAWISILGSVVAVAANYFWLQHHEDGTAEPLSQYVIAITWLLVALLQLLIPSDPEWEVIHAKRAKHDQELLQRVLKCLQEERLDFDQIVSRRGKYNSAAHRKAAEVDSFDLLLPEIRSLRSVPKFSRRASGILKEIERNQALDKKDVERLIGLLNHIEPQLQKEIERLGRVHRGLV